MLTRRITKRKKLTRRDVNDSIQLTGRPHISSTQHTKACTPCISRLLRMASLPADQTKFSAVRQTPRKQRSVIHRTARDNHTSRGLPSGPGDNLSCMQPPPMRLHRAWEAQQSSRRCQRSLWWCRTVCSWRARRTSPGKLLPSPLPCLVWLSVNLFHCIQIPQLLSVSAAVSRAAWSCPGQIRSILSSLEV